MEIKQALANKENYGKQRAVSEIKYIVLHYTANDGDTDESNGKYFKNHIVKASSHYFVDSDSITQSVPDDYVAYSVGGSKYNDCAKTGGGKLYGKATNVNTINVELCDDNKNGTIYPSEATIANAVEFVRSLMKKYGIDKGHVIRHFDVTGKHCPSYWMDDEKWNAEFLDRLDGDESTSVDVEVKTEAVEKEETSETPFQVKIRVALLNVRDGAGKSYKVNTTVKKGYKFTIVEVKNNWGKLKSGAGWISLSEKYVERV